MCQKLCALSISSDFSVFIRSKKWMEMVMFASALGLKLHLGAQPSGALMRLDAICAPHLIPAFAGCTDMAKTVKFEGGLWTG